MEEMKSPFTLLVGIVLILGGLSLGGTAVLHLLQPPLFQATTRIKLDAPPGSSGGLAPRLVQAEVRTMQSDLVLANVAYELKLNDVWGKKYNGGQRLSDPDVEKMIRFECRPVRNTDLIEIKATSDNPTEAMMLANGIAKSYREVAAKNKTAIVNVVMPATAPTRAVSPNRPLLMGVIAAGVFMVVGGIVCLGDSAAKSED